MNFLTKARLKSHTGFDFVSEGKGEDYPCEQFKRGTSGILEGGPSYPNSHRKIWINNYD